jgi:hypothetical protein
VIAQWNRRVDVSGHDIRDQADAELLVINESLLEALRDMVSDHADLSEGTIAFARRAIAKATGSAQ